MNSSKIGYRFERDKSSYYPAFTKYYMILFDHNISPRLVVRVISNFNPDAFIFKFLSLFLLDLRSPSDTPWDLGWAEGWHERNLTFSLFLSSKAPCPFSQIPVARETHPVVGKLAPKDGLTWRAIGSSSEASNR
jgi:hypothetical protein